MHVFRKWDAGKEMKSSKVSAHKKNNYNTLDSASWDCNSVSPPGPASWVAMRFPSVHRRSADLFLDNTKDGFCFGHSSEIYKGNP